jgi:pyruvate-formate lyase-activating enzyme
MQMAINYYHYRKFVLVVLRRWFEILAMVRGRRFRCRSLDGTDRHGIFIGSDMAVRCNCQDFDGSARIGDLRADSFEDIFAGPVATGFRRQLARGKLPVDRCAACWHLQSVPVAEALEQVTAYSLPKGLSVENTCSCNLNCLSCCRRQILRSRHGGVSLSPEDVEMVARTMARLGAEHCGFYDLGEPFLSATVRQELETIRRHNPQIKILTSTNGLLIDTDEKREAALLVDHVLFSIDGVTTPMVRRYQRGGDFDKAFKNLTDLVAFRNRRGRRAPRIEWKYVVFRWNDSPTDIHRAIELAQEAGVDAIQFLFARTPVYGISLPFLFSPRLRKLGAGRSRVVEFEVAVHGGLSSKEGNGCLVK